MNLNITKEFFSLLINLTISGIIAINNLSQEDAQVNKNETIELLEIATQLLKNHKSLEKKMLLDVDQTLQGVLTLIYQILNHSLKVELLKKTIIDRVKELDLINVLFPVCLFSEHALEGEALPFDAQCFTYNCRHAAFQAINSYLDYLEPHQMIEFIETRLVPLIKDIERPKRWNHAPASQGRVGQFIGINNPGCICYMISMLQQFYMTP